VKRTAHSLAPYWIIAPRSGCITAPLGEQFYMAPWAQGPSLTRGRSCFLRGWSGLTRKRQFPENLAARSNFRLGVFLSWLA
jgi:hypothetical protein